MNYRQTIDYLYARLPMFHRIGPAAYKADLLNTWALASHLGNPQQKFKSIHIAGTNGKGSVASMLASVFQEAGYKTGLCTSPHLKDFRERFRINGKMIDQDFIVDFVRLNRDFFEQINPSFFELTIAMAFDYFARQEVDVAIVETGLGGRLDSTNIIEPELSIITNIGFDHVNLLGDTLEKIAFEKAGIIKAGVPVVVGKTRSEALKVITDKARIQGSACYLANDMYHSSRVELSATENQPLLCFYLQSENKNRYIKSALTGLCQLENIATVVASIDVINATESFAIPEKALIDGILNVLKNTELSGRWQVLEKAPLIVCDTGHNEDGIRSVLANIKATPHKKLHLVLGFMNDKDIGSVLDLLPNIDTSYYFCRPNMPRGLDTRELQNNALAKGICGATFDSVRQALEAARLQADKEDLIFVGGSTFVVAEIL